MVPPQPLSGSSLAGSVLEYVPILADESFRFLGPGSLGWGPRVPPGQVPGLGARSWAPSLFEDLNKMKI